MTVIPAYAALLALLFIALSIRTIRARRALKVALGTGGHAALERAMRVHANFAEYVPLALLLLVMAELRGMPALVLHGLALALLVGRCAHAWGVSQTPEDFRFRVAGMICTFTVIGMTALALLASYVMRV
jgi:uncharacterized membrane protein YecN with MAPEG domain